MCIRDRSCATARLAASGNRQSLSAAVAAGLLAVGDEHGGACLLYTSDAADERSSVDLGGRRIIKKKKNTE